GYTEGSIWFNRDTNSAWVCLSAQTNNATWVKTNVSATDLGSAAFVDHGTGMADVPTNSDMRSLLGSTDLDKGTSIVSYSNGLSLQDSFPLIHKTNLVGLLSFSQGEMEGVATQLNEIVSGVYSSPKIYFWDKNYSKALCDGILSIDPDNIGGFDGSIGTMTGFLDAQGSGTGLGAWRVSDTEYLSPRDVGLQGETGEDAQPLLQRLIQIASSKAVKVVIDSEYVLKTKGTGYLNPILNLPSNTTLVFLEGSKLSISNLSTSASYGILHIEDVDNV